MPPVECLKLLSEMYQISINEILAGERLEQKEYKDIAEENITVALEKIEDKGKNLEKKMLFIMGITMVLFIATMWLLPSGSGLSTTEKIKEIIAVILIMAMAFISNTLNIVALALGKENDCHKVYEIKRTKK